MCEGLFIYLFKYELEFLLRSNQNRNYGTTFITHTGQKEGPSKECGHNLCVLHPAKNELYPLVIVQFSMTYPCTEKV